MSRLRKRPPLDKWAIPLDDSNPQPAKASCAGGSALPRQRGQIQPRGVNY